MRPRTAPPGPPRPVRIEVAGLTAVAVVLAGWVVASSELAGWTATGRWSRPDPTEIVRTLARLPHHLADPAAAWLPAVAAARTGAWLFYGWALATAACLAAVIFGAAAVLRRVGARVGPHRSAPRPPGPFRPAPFRPGPFRDPHGSQGARWARTGDLKALVVRRPGRGRLVIGRAAGGRLVATEERHSLLVLGPTQSGKTSGLAVPAILEWDGPVVATSVKDDLARNTLAWRRRMGPCAVFDPTAASGLRASRWSPLSACPDWSQAQRVAAFLVEATPGRRGMADAAFWYTTAAKQLAPLLLAAQRGGLGMSDVVRWTNSSDFDEPARLLEVSGEWEACGALTACAGREERIRSSVSTTLETVLAPFEDPTVASSTGRSDIDVAGILGGSGTLYLCGPSHEQNRVQGLFAALVSTVVAEVFAMVAAGRAPLDPPLLLVLDEAANIAPIRDLDTLASTAAGLGIQLVTVCQDLAQLAARYDPERARTITNNHRAKLLLSGLSDLGTLDVMSGLAGEQVVREVTTTDDLRDGRRTRSTSSTIRRLAPTDELRRTPPGQGVLVYGHLPAARVRLRPWFADAGLRRRAAPDPTARAG